MDVCDGLLHSDDPTHVLESRSDVECGGHASAIDSRDSTPTGNRFDDGRVASWAGRSDPTGSESGGMAAALHIASRFQRQSVVFTADSFESCLMLRSTDSER
jgi:hypothetical protein